MVRQRPLNMDNVGIGFDAYKELYHFCQQYGEKKRAAQDVISPSSVWPKIVALPDKRGCALPRAQASGSSPVESMAFRREQLLRDVNMIEQAARTADASLYPYILKAATTKDSMRSIHPPCGERQFLEARRRFFLVLWQMKNGRL